MVGGREPKALLSTSKKQLCALRGGGVCFAGGHTLPGNLPRTKVVGSAETHVDVGVRPGNAEAVPLFGILAPMPRVAEE